MNSRRAKWIVLFVVLPGLLSGAFAAADIETDVNGIRIKLGVEEGLKLQGLGAGVRSSGGRVFAIRVAETIIYSDQVIVTSTESVAYSGGLAINFDLPGGLGSGVYELSPASEPGIVLTSLRLTNTGTAGTWRVLFPLLERLSLDARPGRDIEFFFPFQEGWLGRGEYDIIAAYGHRAWLPIVAAWNPTGSGLAIQLRDSGRTFKSVRFRNVSESSAPKSWYPDPLGMAEAFPISGGGLSLSGCSMGFELNKGQEWRSTPVAIHVYDGRRLFKVPFKSYELWARSVWWKHHRPNPAWLRDSFLSFSVHERSGSPGIKRGFHDGTRFVCADQIEEYRKRFGGHAFTEWAYWWERGARITSGTGLGTLFPHTHGNYGYELSWGGLNAYRSEFERCRSAGGRVCLYVQGRIVWKESRVGLQHRDDWGYMDFPGHFNEDWSGEIACGARCDFWSMCPQAVGWQDFLRNTCERILKETNVDAVRLDSQAEALVCVNPRHGHDPDPLNGLLMYLSKFPGPTHVNLFCDECMLYAKSVTQRYFWPTCRSI